MKRAPASLSRKPRPPFPGSPGPPFPEAPAPLPGSPCIPAHSLDGAAAAVVQWDSAFGPGRLVQRGAPHKAGPMGLFSIWFGWKTRESLGCEWSCQEPSLAMFPAVERAERAESQRRKRPRREAEGRAFGADPGPPCAGPRLHRPFPGPSSDPTSQCNSRYVRSLDVCFHYWRPDEFQKLWALEAGKKAKEAG